MAIHFVKKQARWPLFFIAFLKGSKQLDQVLENFKYSFYFDGITLRSLRFLIVNDCSLINVTWCNTILSRS